jgi:Co/Zn/Cd efflux system component
VSWVGIGLAAVTAPTMPFLAAAKRRVGDRLNSSATVSEAAQNQLCAYLSIALLIGLLANALVGWWWADPAAALVIAALAAKKASTAGAATAAIAANRCAASQQRASFVAGLGPRPSLRPRERCNSGGFDAAS